jgi:hypothetical protein
LQTGMYSIYSMYSRYSMYSIGLYTVHIAIWSIKFLQGN